MKKLITIAAILISMSAFSQAKKDSVIVLTGDATRFSILFALINTPDDVTANQKKMVIDWINKGIMVMPKELFTKKQN
jgi:hypothetical protein